MVVMLVVTDTESSRVATDVRVAGHFSRLVKRWPPHSLYKAHQKLQQHEARYEQDTKAVRPAPLFIQHVVAAAESSLPIPLLL